MNRKIKIRRVYKAKEIKGNQATILRNAQNVVRARSPEDAKKVESNRSRIETRVTRIYRLDDPVQLGLFGAHTLVRTWRKTEHLAGKLKRTTTEEIAFHASSVRIGPHRDANFFGDCVRGEWSVEKNHARRNGTYCEDIRTRRCNENVTGALMLARTMALYFFAKSGMSNYQAFKEEM